MAVLNTTSPALAALAPIARPRNTVPSASARIAGTGSAGTAWIPRAVDMQSGKGLFAFPASKAGNYTAASQLPQSISRALLLGALLSLVILEQIRHAGHPVRIGY